MPLAETIGSWSENLLQRAIRDAITQEPPHHLGSLLVDQLNVTSSLTVLGRVVRTDGVSRTAALTNSWSAASPPYAAPSFARSNGWVVLAGAITGGVVGTPALQLPPGYRPSATVAFSVETATGIGIAEVDASGNVTPLAPSSAVRVSLDTITFKAA